MARTVEAVGAMVAGGMLVACAMISPAVDAPPAPFPECDAEAFAFHGRTSLAAIGLGDIVGGPEAQRAGEVWVTAGPGDPANWPPPRVGAPPAPIGRVVCVEFDDGSGMSTTIDDAWRPPGDVLDPAGGAGGAPLAVAVVVIAVAVLVGGSLLAFRGRQGEAG